MASDEVRMTIKLMDEQRLALLCDAIAELRRIQWQEDVNGRLFCASCERLFDEGHKPDCTLAAVLKRANDTP